MPKRRNPFGDGSPLQFKTHVGTKELNTGVAGEHNMKAVYERTKQKLFSGAQTLYNSGITMVTDANDNSPFVVDNNAAFINTETCTPGQLVMDSGGQLTLRSMLRQNGEDMETVQESSSCASNPTSCKYTWDFLKQKGKISSVKTQDNCSFCEKKLRVEELLQCHLCQGSFCQLCSTTNYDESFERIFCLNCLT